MDLNLLQLMITALGTIGFPIFAFYVKSKIMEQLNAFRLEMVKQIAEYRQDAAVKEARSDMRYIDIERRILVVENGHESISDRLDQLVNALRSESEKRQTRSGQSPA